MSKEKKVVSAVVAPEPQAVPADPQPVPTPAFVPPQEKLSDVDRLSLDLAKTKRQTALAEAKTALANNENAELQFKYLVLQLYMKYGLTAQDALSEAGDIIRGGAVQQSQG
jgi:hypothetical protein